MSPVSLPEIDVGRTVSIAAYLRVLKPGGRLVVANVVTHDTAARKGAQCRFTWASAGKSGGDPTFQQFV
jgi:plasmid replication initiation protein